MLAKPVPRSAALLTECFLLCNSVLMSSKALPPFRKNCRFTWWRFYIPARNFTAQSLRSVCFPHTSWQSHISIQPGIQFSRCRDQSFHQTSKTKENMHSSRKNILIKFLVCRYRSLSALYIGLLKKHRKINPLPSIFLDKFFRRNPDPSLAACEHIPCIFQIPSLIKWQKIICVEPNILKNA